jgi:hypothetical protein
MAQEIEIGELVTRIKADASQLERELKRVSGITKKQADDIADSFGGLKEQLRELVPALTVAAFVEFGRRAVEAASHIQDLSQRIGFAASTLSALEAPLAKTGADLDSFAGSINLMNNLLGEAAKGNQEAVRAFDDLGLSVRKLQQMSPEQQFYAVIDALAKLETQYEQTNAGRAIFGRGWASLIPLVKESNGALGEHIEKQKELGEALSDEKIERISRFGNAMKEAGLETRDAWLEAFAAVLKVSDYIADNFGEGSKGAFVLAKVGNVPTYGKRPATPNSPDTFTIPGGMSYAPEMSFPGSTKPDAHGGNQDLLKDKNDKKIEAEDYDTLTNSVDDYIRKLDQENELLQMNERERAGMQAVYEAQNDAIKEGNLLSPREIDYIKQKAEANFDLKQKLDDVDTANRRMRENLVDGLNDIVLHFNSASDAADRFFENIASQIITKKITTPLADSIIGSLDGSGIGSFLKGIFGGARASGGPVAAGKAYVVGENQPELFVPNTSGMIYPSAGAGGGTTVTVVQHNTFGNGISRSEVASMLPALAQASKRAVFDEIQRGGHAAQIVGRKS